MILITIDYETLVRAKLHIAYCACAIKACNTCIDYDPEILICPSHGERQYTFYGLDAAEQLSRWLFFDPVKLNNV